MASHTFVLLLSVATLFAAVLAEYNEDEADALYRLYNDAMQKRDDGNLMDFLMEKRGRGSSTRKCMHKGSVCTCDYRFGPASLRRYSNCFKIPS